MLTGDGWLARFVPAAGLTGAQAAGLAAAAGRLGNGRIEVTGRGSLQVRGLTPETAEELGRVVDGLGIAVRTGLAVVTGALAGIDPEEAADPRPLAEAIRRRAAGLRLGPKASVVVDGGGALHLDAVGADVRLRAAGGRWEVSVGERVLGGWDAPAATEAAVQVLGRLAARGPGARGRAVAGEAAAPARPPAVPVGRIGASALGIGLAFGQTDAGGLAALAAAAGGAELRPAPGRALVAVGLGEAEGEALRAAAEGAGFVVDPRDPRLAIVACSGAGACGSAHLATRALAAEIAARRPELLEGVRLHLSGCAKRCAQPAMPSVSLVAGTDGNVIEADRMAVPDGLRAFLEAVG